MIINDWRAAVFWLRVTAVGYWQGIRADGLSPDSVGTGRVVQQITDLTPLQVEVIRSVDLIAMLGIAKGFIAADVIVCVQSQTVCNSSTLVHATNNGA